MKENDFLDGVSNVDPDVVERFVSMDNKLQKKANKSKSKGIWLRFGAIAACLALIVGAITTIPMFRQYFPESPISSDTTEHSNTVSPPVTNNHTPIIFDATVSPEQLRGNSLEFIVGSSLSFSGVSAAPPAFRFETGNFVVKARVKNNLPDTYYKLNVSSVQKPTAYRLIEMETIEVLNGQNIPETFLYLIPSYTFVDMSIYDSLMISMNQLGTTNYVLRNDSQNKMESFELPIFSDDQDLPELGNIIAFTDGIFDESLWQNYTWLYGYQFARYYLDNPQYSNLVVGRGDSEETVIANISEQTYFNPSVFMLPEFKTQEAKDAIEFVKPFENGVFLQSLSSNHLIFRRYINGCETEETVSIDLETEVVTYSEVRYTREDMSRIENLSAHLSNKAKEYAEELPTPPHTDPEGKELLCLNLYAWYVKVDGMLYGVIKTSWRYMEYDNYYIQFYDDSYIIYDISGATATDISRDDLLNIVGTRNVYMGEYGIGIEMPM